MAKITKTSRPSVPAPTLTRGYQRIDTPRGSFGGNVGVAIDNLGASVEFGANILGNALLRQQARNDATSATTVSTATSKQSFTDNEEAKKNPGDLTTFATRQDKLYDDTIKKATVGMSKGAARLTTQRLNNDRASQFKSNTLYANGQIIKEGKVQSDSAISNMISTASTKAASGDTNDLSLMYSDIKDEAYLSTQLDFRGTDLPEDTYKEWARTASLTVVDSMIMNQPAELKKLLDDGELQELSQGDIDTINNDIIKSIDTIGKRAQYSEVTSMLSHNADLAGKVTTGTLTPADINNAVSLGKMTETNAVVMKDWLLEPETLTTQQKIDKQTAKTLIRKAGNKQADLIEAELEAPHKREMDAIRANLIDDYTEELEKLVNSDVDSLSKVNSVLKFTDKVFDALDKGALSDKDFKGWMSKLAPAMTDIIESKYATTDLSRPGITAPAGVFGNPQSLSFFSKPKNPYSSNYLAALNILKTTAPDNVVAGRPEAKIEIMGNVMQGIEQSKTMDKADREEFLNNLPQKIVTDLLRDRLKIRDFDTTNSVVDGVSFGEVPVPQTGKAFTQNEKLQREMLEYAKELNK